MAAARRTASSMIIWSILTTSGSLPRSCFRGPRANGLEYYSGWPNVDLPFVVDSPYFKLIPRIRRSTIVFLVAAIAVDVRSGGGFHRIRRPDRALAKVGADIESLIKGLNEILQARDSSRPNFPARFRNTMKDVERGVSELVGEVSGYINQHLTELNGELLQGAGMIVLKVREDRNFDFSQIGGSCSGGTTDWGTSYVVFHKSL